MCLSQIFSEYILPNIGSILMFGATIGLLCLTNKYLRATRKMADAMEKELEIKLKPMVNISFDKIQIPSGIRFPLYKNIYRITNAGSFSVYLSQFTIFYYRPETPDTPDNSIYSYAEGVHQYIGPDDSYEVSKHYPPTQDMVRIVEGDKENVEVLIVTIFDFLDARGKEFKKETREKENYNKSTFIKYKDNKT